MQQIAIKDKRAFSASEVKDVLAFSDKEIKLLLSDGKRLTGEGAGLKIVGFDKSSGDFEAEGEVGSIRFVGAKESIVKRVFK